MAGREQGQWKYSGVNCLFLRTPVCLPLLALAKACTPVEAKARAGWCSGWLSRAPWPLRAHKSLHLRLNLFIKGAGDCLTLGKSLMTPFPVNASLALLLPYWTAVFNLSFYFYLNCIHSVFVCVLVRVHICMCVNEGSWWCVINTTTNVPKG